MIERLIVGMILIIYMLITLTLVCTIIGITLVDEVYWQEIGIKLTDRFIENDR